MNDTPIITPKEQSKDVESLLEKISSLIDPQKQLSDLNNADNEPQGQGKLEISNITQEIDKIKTEIGKAGHKISTQTKELEQKTKSSPEEEMLYLYENILGTLNDMKIELIQDDCEIKDTSKITSIIKKVIQIFNNNRVSLISLMISLMILFFSIKFSILPFIINQKKSQFSNELFIMFYVVLSILILSLTFYYIYINEKIPQIDTYKSFMWIGAKWKIFLDSNNSTILWISFVCLLISSVMLYISGIENFFLISGYKLSIYRLLVTQSIALVFITQLILTILIAENTNEEDDGKFIEINIVPDDTRARDVSIFYNIITVALVVMFSGMLLDMIIVSSDFLENYVRKKMFSVCYFTLVGLMLVYIYIAKEPVNKRIQYQFNNNQTEYNEFYQSKMYNFLLRFILGIRSLELKKKNTIVLVFVYFILCLLTGIIAFTKGLKRAFLATSYRLNFYRIVFIEFMITMLIVAFVLTTFEINDAPVDVSNVQNEINNVPVDVNNASNEINNEPVGNNIPTGIQNKNQEN